MLIVGIQRMFNVNVITGKLIAPLTKKVKSLITLKPQSRDDYYSIGRHWVYKKLFLTVILLVCAGVFIYFTMFAPKLVTAPVTQTAVKTDVTYNYDDMKLKDFTGVANIRAADGTTVYVGDIKAGACTGNGALKDRKGRIVYEGGFDQNKYSGKGVSYYISGSKKYEGSFAENLYSGQGSLYADGGKLIYTGEFKEGKYSGKGMAYDESGKLLYEGEFADGMYHGTGTSYYADGTTAYTGEFFQGKPQGTGTLYNAQGKPLYTGAMYDGKISYRSLVGATLEDVETAFQETPKLFYSDLDSVFVFEQAGVILTVDCRVKVDTWQRPSANNGSGENYFLPGDSGFDPNPAVTDPQGAIGSEVPKEPDTATAVVTTGWKAAGELLGTSVKSASALAFGTGNSFSVNAGLISPMAWYVGGAGSESSDSSDSGTQSTPQNSDGTDSSSSYEDSSGLMQGDSSDAAASEGSSGTAGTQPGFVEKNQKLYFEIDKDVWQSEDELDKSKVKVSCVTVFGDTERKAPETAAEYQDGGPPSIEDCVAIDYIRQDTPTAFSNVVFQMEKQNKLFIRLQSINYASGISRNVYTVNGLTYRYCYPLGEEEKPLYYSIRK